MKDADKTSQQLSAYLDGELPEGEAKKLAAAIEADPALAAELGELRALRRLVGDLPREQAGDEFVSAVLARAERMDLVGHAHVQAGQKGPQLLRWMASAAVVLIAVGVTTTIAIVMYSSARTGPDVASEGITSNGQIARGDVPSILAKPHAEDAAAKDQPVEKKSPAALAGVREGAGEVSNGLVAGGRSSRAAELGDRLTESANSTEGATIAPPAPAAARAPEMALGTALPTEGVSASREPARNEPETGEKGDELALVPSAASGQALALVNGDADKALDALGMTFDDERAPASAPAAGVGVAAPGRVSDVLPSGTVRETVYADNVDLARNRIEHTLLLNNVAPYGLRDNTPVEDAAPEDLSSQLAAAPNYRAARETRPEQAEVFAYLNPSQMSAVMDEVRSMQGLPPTVAAAWGAAGSGTHALATGGEGAQPPAAARNAGGPDSRRGWVAVEEVNGQLQLRSDAPAPIVASRSIASRRAGVAYARRDGSATAMPQSPAAQSQPGISYLYRSPSSAYSAGLATREAEGPVTRLALRPLLISIQQRAASTRPAD
jgi:hypothetical protein